MELYYSYKSIVIIETTSITREGNPMIKCWHILVLCSVFYLASQAQAETKYVTDTLSITLRTGQGNQFKILSTLKSGSIVEIIEQADGFTKIKTQKGIIGWVRSQYLVNNPVALNRIKIVENKITQLEAENNRLKQNLATTTGNSQNNSQKFNQLTIEHKKLQQEFTRISEIAARPLEFAAENRTLKEKTITLEKKVEALQKENTTFKSQSNQHWFLYGAGVLIGGILFGLIIPRIRWRKKSEWSL